VFVSGKQRCLDQQNDRKMAESLSLSTEIKMTHWLNSGIGILFCFVLIFAATFGAFMGLPASLHYHISEHYSLSASQESALVYLGVLVPQSGPYQTIKDLRVLWDGEQDRESTPCVDVIKLSGLVTSGTSQDAIIEYQVRLSHGIVLWRAQPDSCHLLPDCMVESDHPDIVARANQIVDGTSWRDAYRIFTFTKNYFSPAGDFVNCSMEMSALEAYQSGTGECGEYSRLMVALCRASGIPSLVTSGILLPDSSSFAAAQSQTWGHPGVAHAWVEFSDRNIWSMADPAWGASTWDILHFGRNDGRHLSYGCINHEGSVYTEMLQWADQHGSLIGKEFAALKFVAAADADHVTIAPVVTVRKGWDGRWLNALLALTATTFLLYFVRNRLSRSG